MGPRHRRNTDRTRARHFIYRASCNDRRPCSTRTSRSVDLSALLSVGGGGAPRAPAQVRSINDTFHQRSRAPDGE